MSKLRNTFLAAAAAVALSSCFLDSVEPWLEADSIMPAELDLEGDWSMANGEFKNKYKVELSKDRSSRSKDKQNYYIKVLPQLFDSSFNFRGAVHQVNGIKLLQITNFSHFGDDVFSLANRPTISLWQIAYDADNIIIWAPPFVTEPVGDLKTMQDSDDKRLFIDSTENLQDFLYDWTRNYAETRDSIRNIIPLALTRFGTEFRMPEEMRNLVPRVYEDYLKQAQRAR